MFMLKLMVTLGFFNDPDVLLGWEKRVYDNAIVICLYTDEIVKGAESESDFQFLDIVQINNELRPVFSYCNLAPMNSEYYYGQNEKVSKK